MFKTLLPLRSGRLDNEDSPAARLSWTARGHRTARAAPRHRESVGHLPIYHLSPFSLSCAFKLRDWGVDNAYDGGRFSGSRNVISVKRCWNSPVKAIRLRLAAGHSHTDACATSLPAEVAGGCANC